MSSIDEFLSIGDNISEVIAPILDFASLAITREFVSTRTSFSRVLDISQDGVTNT